MPENRNTVGRKTEGRKSAVRRPVRKKTAGGNSAKKKPAKRKTPGLRRKKVRLSLWAAFGAAAGIFIAIILLCTRKSFSEYETGAKVPPGEWRYGIDISNNNEGRIVWDSLFVMTDSRMRTVRDPYKAKEIRPVSFVFIKATEGASFKDKSFERNWLEAGRSGIKRGAYHFFRSSKDGKAQARNFIGSVPKLRHSDLPPVLDIEALHKGCSKSKLNEEALKWLREVEKHYGRKPIVYTNVSFAKDCLSKEITESYPVWIAHYGKDRPDFEGWRWWQFTDRAVVKGVDGKVDLNVMPVGGKAAE
ncbi:MAG: GH25 family lysozyme [Candidatus Cryptobacteroides sp.]